VFAVLAEARGADRAVVKLFRVTGPNKYGWCADYSVEEFEAGGFAMIRRDWGAGEYEIRLYAPHPVLGGFKVRAKPRITIEADPRASAEPQGTRAAAAAPSELLLVLRQMQESQAAMLQAITQRAPAPDPLASLQQVIGLAGAMRSAFAPTDAAPRNNLGEIIGAIKELRAAADEINPPAPAAADPDNPMAMLPGILETVRAFAPAVGSGAAPAQAPVQAFPPVTLPPSFAAPPSDPNPAHMAAQGSAPDPLSFAQRNPATSSQSTNEESGVNALGIVALQGYLRSLIMMAQANRPPEEGAKLIYEKLPDDLLDLMDLDTWFDLLAQVAPEVKPHEAWMRAARDKAIAMFDADSNNQSVQGG